MIHVTLFTCKKKNKENYRLTGNKFVKISYLVRSVSVYFGS